MAMNRTKAEWAAIPKDDQWAIVVGHIEAIDLPKPEPKPEQTQSQPEKTK